MICITWKELIKYWLDWRSRLEDTLNRHEDYCRLKNIKIFYSSDCLFGNYVVVYQRTKSKISKMADCGKFQSQYFKFLANNKFQKLLNCIELYLGSGVFLNTLICMWAVFLTQSNILLQLVKMTILLSLSLISCSTNIYENFCDTYLRFQPSIFKIWRQTEFLKNILN